MKCVQTRNQNSLESRQDEADAENASRMVSRGKRVTHWKGAVVEGNT